MKKNVWVLLICLFFLQAVRPADELPSLPSLDDILAKNSSASMLPPPVQSPSTKSPSASLPPVSAKPSDGVKNKQAPIMLDQKNVDGSNLKDSVKTTEKRSINLDKIVGLLFDIDKVSSSFSSLEKELEEVHGSVEKQINVALNELSIVLGASSVKAVELSEFLSSPGFSDGIVKIAGDAADKKRALVKESAFALQEVLKSLDPQAASLKLQQGELTSAEDAVRQKIVDFKRKKAEFSENYAKASSLKNDIVVQASDGEKEIAMINELLSKSKATLTGSSKEADEIKKSLNSLKGLLEKILVDKKTVEAAHEKIKKELSLIGDANGLINYFIQQNGLVVMPSAQGSKQDKNDEAKKNNDGEDSDKDKNENMAYRVFGALKQGAGMALGMTVAAYHKVMGNGPESAELTKSRGELKDSSITFFQSAKNMAGAVYQFVKNLFKSSPSEALPEKTATMPAPDIPGSGVASVASSNPSNTVVAPGAIDLTLPVVAQKELTPKNESLGLPPLPEIKNEVPVLAPLPPIIVDDKKQNKAGSVLPELTLGGDKKIEQTQPKKELASTSLPPLPSLKI
ncbi:hypothetical protein FJ366_00245 [Candidatus Dependentiae bacterium]|nr:hypothetical protein [Candidatus Dependentiae bacterium]